MFRIIYILIASIVSLFWYLIVLGLCVKVQEIEVNRKVTEAENKRYRDAFRDHLNETNH